MTASRAILVLGGGPDAEREVSINSSTAVFESIKSAPGFTATLSIIDRPSLAELRALPGDVVFPVLHGGFGEGGPLQDMLEADGRPYVGCGPRAARLAMDKLATKLAAARCGVPTLPSGALNLADDACPFELPTVVKPVHEGSSVGVHICRSGDDWANAIRAVRADRVENPTRMYMVESAALGGRELTVGVIDGVAQPIVEIRPSVEFYDYQAKYKRSDTKYTTDPDLPPGMTERLKGFASTLAREMGVRHLCRVDFILDSAGNPWLLEVNTMPGFTGRSLLPMAAAKSGMNFTQLCVHLVQLALRDAPRRR